MATPRTPDDGRNDKQRAQYAREQEAEHEASSERDQRPVEKAEGEDRDRLLAEKPFDFIERTRPEDRLEGTNYQGQLTRDNVNPNIPSVSPEETGPPIARIPNPGGIVDPHTLGMPQASGGPEPRVEPPETAKDAKEVPPLPDAHPDDLAARYVSPNEPWGSNVGTGDTGTAPAALDLTGLNPDHGTIGTPVLCSVHGTGFTADCVVIIDDEEVPATFVNSGKFTVDVPMAEEPGTVDVEVGRGEEMSDILTFEWIAAAGTRKSEKAERKPKKAEPAAKRAKKPKGKR